MMKVRWVDRLHSLKPHSQGRLLPPSLPPPAAAVLLEEVVADAWTTFPSTNGVSLVVSKNVMAVILWVALSSKSGYSESISLKNIEAAAIAAAVSAEPFSTEEI
ncbi:hypothetical protein F2Q68_00026329 [Brassica cretica]|uniref:Uncharacterized protein n=2 Tax=Brassica cretica TaxID=69181 RepID=A0A8S9II70_BRACR|nr:hypothetical protein F2Q68_00026329 [Brassica cretica]KAF3579497.1 hypothetical protein DY000_02032614 [Brassica cretica]